MILYFQYFIYFYIHKKIEKIEKLLNYGEKNGFDDCHFEPLEFVLIISEDNLMKIKTLIY